MRLIASYVFGILCGLFIGKIVPQGGSAYLSFIPTENSSFKPFSSFMSASNFVIESDDYCIISTNENSFRQFCLKHNHPGLNFERGEERSGKSRSRDAVLGIHQRSTVQDPPHVPEEVGGWLNQDTYLECITIDVLEGSSGGRMVLVQFFKKKENGDGFAVCYDMKVPR